SDWHGWDQFGPSGTATSLAVGQHNDGRLEILAITPSGGVTSKYETQADGAWSDRWIGFAAPGTGTNLAGAHHQSGRGEDLAVANHQSGRVEIFAVTSDGQVWTKYETKNNSDWHGWDQFSSPGQARSVVVGKHASGRLEVFAVKPDGDVVTNYETKPDEPWS